MVDSEDVWLWKKRIKDPWNDGRTGIRFRLHVDGVSKVEAGFIDEAGG